MAGDRRRGRHLRAHEVGAAAPALPALEVAVRRRGAALARRQDVRVHAEAHRAAGVAPLEPCVQEHLVEAFLLGLRACTWPEPGTTIAVTRRRDLAGPATMAAAARRSSMREFVHEPMKTRSMVMSSIACPGRSPMYSSARPVAMRSSGSAYESGSGTLPVTGRPCRGSCPRSPAARAHGCRSRHARRTSRPRRRRAGADRSAHAPSRSRSRAALPRRGALPIASCCMDISRRRWKTEQVTEAAHFEHREALADAEELIGPPGSASPTSMGEPGAAAWRELPTTASMFIRRRPRRDPT